MTADRLASQEAKGRIRMLHVGEMENRLDNARDRALEAAGDYRFTRNDVEAERNEKLADALARALAAIEEARTHGLD